MRFVVLNLITAPPNYRWQQYLERTFPAYLHEGARPARQDVEEAAAAAAAKPKSEDDSFAHKRDEAPRKLNWKNTMTKWFLDCISVGALLNTVAFLSLMGVMKGQEMNQVAETVRTVGTTTTWRDQELERQLLTWSRRPFPS